MPTQIIICIDGCSPEYLAKSQTPNLDAIAGEGFSTIGHAVVPTVTNVNNTTIVTANYPNIHGITSNYFLDLVQNREVYMESSEFLMADTIFRRTDTLGKSSALFTAKDKLKALIQDGATIAESAENPSAWLVDQIGPPPDIYSIEVNHWLFQAAIAALKVKSPDLIYLTTTDYVTHKFPPEAEKSKWNFNVIDRLIGELLNTKPDIELVVTADHGMNPKTRALDLNRILKAGGITVNAIPIIKDRYVVHHQNLGGAAYIYLQDTAAIDDVMAILKEESGIEMVMRKNDAATRYHLHPNRIGNLFVLGDRDTVFGALPGPREAVNIRSHGSLHEQKIPIYAYGPGPESAKPQSNLDVAKWLFI